MPIYRTFWCLVLLTISNLACAQSPDAVKYAPWQLLLVTSELGTEAVLPMVFTTDGQQRLEFVPVSQIKQSVEKGGQPIRLGDVLSALSGATESINKLQQENARLQAENEKLWKVAMKDAPAQPPPTVVVQQSAPPRPSPFEKYLLLRSLVQPVQPYRLPAPVQPIPMTNPNRLQTNCMSQTIGGLTSTDCH